jgi:hypothetical protein
MFPGFAVGVFLAIIVAVLGGYIVLRAGIIPANSDATPGAFETWAAERRCMQP